MNVAVNTTLICQTMFSLVFRLRIYMEFWVAFDTGYMALLVHAARNTDTLHGIAYL